VRFISSIIGAVVGAIVGLVSALFLVTIMVGNNLLSGAFILMWAAPVGLLVGAALGVVVAVRILPHLRAREHTGPARRKKILLVLSLIIGIPALVAGMLWEVSNSHKPPSDQKLLENFDRHEATFDQLIQMAQTDKGLTRVDEDWTRPENPQTINVSSARISTYRRLLKEAGVPRGFQVTDTADEVDFYYWGIGSAISSDTDKGYAYLTMPPFNLLPSLDGSHPDERNGDNGVKTYRHIRGNWYLFYEYIPG
jgi:hypothetical protein